MKKWFLFMVIAVFTVISAAENLILNPEFDGDSWNREIRAAEVKSEIEVSQFIEESTWNRCVKMELKKYSVQKNGNRSVGSGVLIGKDGKNDGFVCKPDTLYEFKFELKGNAKRAMVNWYQWDKTGSKKARTSIHLIKPQKEWTVYKGSFRTSKTAHHAALYIQFWGSEGYKDLQEVIGQYVLIDKVSITEADDFRPDAIGKGAPANVTLIPAPVIIAGNSRDKAAHIYGFKDLKEDRPARLRTEADIYRTDNALHVRLDCFGDIVSDSYKGTGDKAIWNDDLVEIFFESSFPQIPYHQFVVSAGGGRWMGNGKPGVLNEYEKWKAEVTRIADGWRVEVEIPFSTLGYGKSPEKGESLLFNLCRQRPVAGIFKKPDYTKGNIWSNYRMFDNSACIFGRGSNHDVKRFATLFLDTMKPFCDNALSGISEEKNDPVVKELVAKISPEQPGIAFAAAAELQKRLQYLRLAKEPFLLAQISPASDFSVPFFPGELQNHGKTLKVRAAVNECAPLVMALANMGTQAEEYRVFINAEWARKDPSYEFFTSVTSLRHEDGTLFPESKIELRRGIPIRDADSPKHERIIDILAKLNEAGTIPVQPKEAGLLWCTFDCSGVKPGIYRGRISVLPLNGENVSFRHSSGRSSYLINGASKDFPVELEVLPVTLPEKSPMPFNSYARPGSEMGSAFLDRYDCFMHMVTPWYFTFRYNPDGSIAEETTRSFLEPQLEKIVGAIRKNPNIQNPKIMVGYSVYSVWKKNLMRKQFKIDTPEYWNAWRNFCKGIDRILKKHGISREEYIMEIFDEPHMEDFYLEELTRAHAEYKKALPDASILMTSGAPYAKNPENFDKVTKNIDSWIFYAGYLHDPSYISILKKFQALPGKKTGVYMCGTSMRQNPYRYYHLLPWQAMEADCDFVSLYQMYPQLAANDLYRVPQGDTAYVLPDTIMPSVRLENFRIGQTDIKYMKLLLELASGNTAEDRGNRDFVKKSVREVVTVAPHDKWMSQKIREQAIERILKYKK